MSAEMDAHPLETPLPLASSVVGEGRPLIVLHGLLGSGRNWATVARQLAEQFQVHVLDLRNHGASSWSDRMTYAAMAEDVRGYMDANGIKSAAVIGHSMGGKAAMVLALNHPERVEKLVVVDIAPVPYVSGLQVYTEALSSVDLTAVDRRSAVDEQLAPSIPDAGIRQFLLQNLVSEDGHLRWRVNLETLNREMGAISGFPDAARAGQYNGPTLFVAGGRSDYIQPEHQQAITQLFPQARTAIVAGAGHWVHAEQPQGFLQAVVPFLS